MKMKPPEKADLTQLDFFQENNVYNVRVQGNCRKRKPCNHYSLFQT
jgi:hypothetical protein